MDKDKRVYSPSIEGAQHGKKGLVGFAEFAKNSGAVGFQPSCSMLERTDGEGFMTAAEIQAIIDDLGLKLSGVSAHCPTWVQTTAWTGSKTIRPFISAALRNAPIPAIENAMESYIRRLFDLCVELGVKVVPMFWGVAFGWELTSGYPWGLWAADDYDLLAEGKDRFVEKTELIRAHAESLGIYLAHEIHPGTAAMCAEDFAMLVELCGQQKCMTVNADPSHCWEGESWLARFEHPIVAARVVGAHVKNHRTIPGLPLRSMEPDWQKRAMQFTALHTGQLDLVAYTEMLTRIGYPTRYCEIMGTETAPLVGEAEGAFEDLDSIARKSIVYIKNELCFPIATESFEEGLGAQD